MQASSRASLARASSALPPTSSPPSSSPDVRFRQVCLPRSSAAASLICLANVNGRFNWWVRVQRGSWLAFAVQHCLGQRTHCSLPEASRVVNPCMTDLRRLNSDIAGRELKCILRPGELAEAGTRICDVSVTTYERALRRCCPRVGRSVRRLTSPMMCCMACSCSEGQSSSPCRLRVKADPLSASENGPPAG